MDLPARRQLPTVRLRRLATELRRLRTAAGLTREDVEKQTGLNAATLYRLETAKSRPQRRTLLALLLLYGVSDETRHAELVALSRQAAELGWLQQFEDDLPEQYTAYISFEAEACGMRTYENVFVPGLLQTEAYARACIKGVLPGVDGEEVERRVEARLQRQESIKKKNALQLWAIIDEAVLEREVGGPDVMVEQLRYLVDVAGRTNITLQVLPYSVGAHPGMHGSFVIMDFPDDADPSLVYIETMAGGLFLEGDDLRRYSTIFEHLRAGAVNPADAVRLIHDRASTT